MAQRQEPQPGASLGDELADAVRRQVDEMTEALRAEVERLQRELADRGRIAARGAGLIGAAGALGLISAAALASLPLIALRKALPPPWLVALALRDYARTGIRRLLREGLGGGRLAVVPGGGHASVASAPDEVARLVAGFVEECRA